MEAIRRRLERRIDQARADLVVRNTRTLNLEQAPKRLNLLLHRRGAV
jgi:hypothetical protein